MTSGTRSVFDLGARRLSRRRLVQGAAAGTAASLIPSVIRPGHVVRAQGTLNILAPEWPQIPHERTLATERFAKETGIGVNIEAVNYGTLEQRIKLLVDGKSSQYDIYDYDSQWIGGFVKAGALERLDTPEFLGGGSAVKYDDFYPELNYRLTKYPTQEEALFEGRFEEFAATPVYGLPWSLNAQALWYRTDLMSAPPASWEEVRTVAKELTKDGMYGMAMQGSRDADWVVHEYTPVMWSNGGELWDQATYTVTGVLNSEQNVASLQFLADMVNVDKSVDPASANWTISERIAAILQGKAAMGLNWVPLFGGIAEDPATSLVPGKIGLAPSPKGSAGQAAMIGCQGTAINAYSEQKDKAWQYLQWWASKETQQAMQDDKPSGFVSGRKDLRDAVQWEWQKVFLEMIPTMRDIWNIPEYAQLLQIAQTEVNLAYVGRKSAQEALDDAALAQQAVLDASPDKPAS